MNLFRRMMYRGMDFDWGFGAAFGAKTYQADFQGTTMQVKSCNTVFLIKFDALSSFKGLGFG